ncbi:MAG TPA: SAM-dependent methyltransferase [Opitutaceae bacterium]|nr:SAM-dependent methyltransferase [Opitutaceae bacterium]
MAEKSQPSARERFLDLLRASVAGDTLVKLTLGKPRGDDPSLLNLFVRPVTLKSGPHLTFVWHHATRDITKNHPRNQAVALLEPLLGRDFLDAHLFTPVQTAQLACTPEGKARLSLKTAAAAPAPPPEGHDREKAHLIPAQASWLRALGVTNEQGRPREGQAAKFRQINKFAELLQHLLAEAGLDEADRSGGAPLQVVDAGCGKGYLTFAISALLRDRAVVRGIEVRPELVALCNRVAAEQGFAPGLSFTAGSIAGTPLAAADILIALHACDTATDEALAQGIAAGSTLIVVAPCCQKELRPQLTAPPVLAGPLRHGIFQERQAEFVTDALRAQLLEWAGYRTKVFEFISTEHTPKNLMIAAIKTRPRGQPDDAQATHIRELAGFYGIRSQALARQLGFRLEED